jgi:hypothetical protein
MCGRHFRFSRWTAFNIKLQLACTLALSRMTAGVLTWYRLFPTKRATKAPSEPVEAAISHGPKERKLCPSDVTGRLGK